MSKELAEAKREEAMRQLINDWTVLGGMLFDSQLGDNMKTIDDKKLTDLTKTSFVAGYVMAKKEAAFGIDWEDYNETID